MRILIALLILTSNFAFAQDEINCFPQNECGLAFDWYNDEINFRPLIANPYEARMGFIGKPSEERLRMDIGATFDLFKLSKQGTFGVDMMTYTRLRSEGRFKFPVETTDYFFGINSAFLFERSPIFGDLFSGVEQLRIRLAHISSHLIDGYTINNEFISPPFVYSREFLEVIYKVNTGYSDDCQLISPYFGGSYVFSKIPNNIESFDKRTLKARKLVTSSLMSKEFSQPQIDTVISINDKAKQ